VLIPRQPGVDLSRRLAVVGAALSQGQHLILARLMIAEVVLDREDGI